MAENDFISERPKGNIAVLIYGLAYLLLGLIAILLALPFLDRLLSGTSNTVYNRFLMAFLMLGIIFILLESLQIGRVYRIHKVLLDITSYQVYSVQYLAVELMEML